MNIGEAVRLRQNERTASRTIEGAAVVIVIDKHELHTLNAVGTRVWELSDGRSLGEIVDEIVSEFEVQREAALGDVTTFVEELVRLGALEVSA